MLRKSTFNVGALRVALTAVEALGVDPTKVLRRMKVDPEVFQRPNERMPLLTGLRFWRTCEELSHDPLIGLKAGCRIDFGKYPLLDYLCASAPTVGEGLQLFSRYVAIVNDILLPKILEHGDRTEIFMDRRFRFFPFRTGDEFHQAILLQRLKFLTNASPAEYIMEFSHVNAVDARMYEEILGVKTVFRAPRNALIVRFPGYLASARSGQAKVKREDIFPLVETVFRRMATSPDEKRPLIVDLHGVFGESCSSGDTGIDPVGKKLGMSARTLQRRLSELSTSFEDELTNYRRYTAISLLEIGTSIDDVAFLLGYQHTTNFMRAFKAWYGVAPGKWSGPKPTS